MNYFALPFRLVPCNAVAHHQRLEQPLLLVFVFPPSLVFALCNLLRRLRGSLRPLFSSHRVERLQQGIQDDKAGSFALVFFANVKTFHLGRLPVPGKN